MAFGRARKPGLSREPGRAICDDGGMENLVDPDRPRDPDLRVLVVCWGNICRSPMAALVLRDRLASAGLGDRVAVTSAGVSSEELGNPIDERAEEVLVSAGYDVPPHRAHQVEGEELAENQLVLAMTERHEKALRDLAEKKGIRLVDTSAQDDGARGKDTVEIRMWREFDTDLVGKWKERVELDAPDPWYGGRAEFEETLATIERSVDGVVDHIREVLDA